MRKKTSKIKHSLLRRPEGKRWRGRLCFYPLHEKSKHSRLLILRQLPALRNTVPLLQATAATTGTGMLGLEHRMPAHGCLVAISNRTGRCQPLSDKIGSMSPQRLHTYAPNIRLILCRKAKAAAKVGLHQPGKRCEHRRKETAGSKRRRRFRKTDTVTATISCSLDPGRCRLPS